MVRVLPLYLPSVKRKFMAIRNAKSFSEATLRSANDFRRGILPYRQRIIGHKRRSKHAAGGLEVWWTRNDFYGRWGFTTEDVMEVESGSGSSSGFS
ncbi:hypothetical protein TIFTF001_022853 [Ficus carica]|uniref:Uncharacterized protein n=1 Tax=Ficus carica TaxID=3494 RepID=A0AA88AF66_FICCA|nr:hypothetical protein TIFTF001_022853 [Ficus carica]